MRKIYFLQQEVRLGELVEFNGLNVVISDKLIKDNPNLFIIKQYTLKDFEVLLNGKDLYYGFLQVLDPSLYYFKLLGEVAKWFNCGKEPKLQDEKWLIGRTSKENSTIEPIRHSTVKYADPYFFKREDAVEAIALFGDKLKYIL